MDKAEMKPLSERQARRCEEAREPVCHCRCGGAKHGARRAGTEGTPRSFFEQLPEDDPHYVPSVEKIAAQKAARKEAERKRKEEIQLKRAEYLAMRGSFDYE
jgi:hypothetical protein